MTQPLFPAKTFDVDRLVRLVEGDVGLLRELRDLFAEDSAKTLSEARRAISSQDADELWRCAHSLKGAVGNFAAPRATELALRLESEARTGSAASSSDLHSELEREIEALLEELGRFLIELS